MADKPNDVYRLNVIHRAMVYAGVLQGGQTAACDAIEEWGQVLDAMPVAIWLSQRMMRIQKKP